MTSEQADLLQHARRSIGAAKANLDLGYPEVAASRAYYAVFYIAQAFLEGDGLRFSSHAEVISAFGRHFAKTGRAPAEYHRFLITSQKLRLDADYRTYWVPQEEAAEQVARAEQFLKLAEDLIGSIPHTDAESSD